MKVGVIIPFLVAAGLGAAAFYVGKDVLRRRAAAPPPPPRTAPILVAARDLDSGKSVSEADLALGALAPENIPPTALVRKADAVDRVVAVPMSKGQIIYDACLAPRSAGTGLQALVPPGMRAVTIEFNDAGGLGAMLSPGCRVDVIASFIDETNHETAAKAIIENARVIQISRGNGSKGADANRSVTLVVSAREAVALEVSTARGKPRLVLRGTGDDTAMPTTAMTASEIAGLRREKEKEKEKPAPATQVVVVAPPPPPPPPPATKPVEPPPPPPGHAVQIIRGGTEQTVVVDKPPTTAPARRATERGPINVSARGLE
jgi:pilus assembly protein CpaB